MSYIKKYSIYILPLFFTFLVSRPVDNYDIWWHLHSGLWMLENLNILDYDLWSFTALDSDWINISWLFQVLIAIAYHIGDVWGLYIVKLICIFVIFYLVLISSDGPDNKYNSYIISLLLLLPFIYGHLHLRPVLFELLTLITIVLLSRRLLNLQILITAIIILLLLANSHASAIVLSTAFSLQVLFGDWEKPIETNKKLLLSIMVFSTPFITPYGVDLINLLFVHDSSDIVKYYVSEWVPRDTYSLGLWLLILLVFTLTILKRTSVSIAETFLLIFFFIYSIKYQRFELELSFLLLRPLIEIIDIALKQSVKISLKFPVLITVFIVLLHAYIFSNQIINLAPSLISNIPYDEHKYPKVTVKYLNEISRSLNRDINVINDYDYGGYISLFTDSTAKVYIDGRMSTLYPESLLIPSYESDPVILNTIVDKYNADAVLLKLGKASTISPANSRWQLIAYDAASVLFMDRSIISDMNLPDLNYRPDIYISAYEEFELDRHIEQTEKLVSFQPDNFLALNQLAVFLSNKINNPEIKNSIFEYLMKSMDLNSNDIFSRATYAYLLAVSETDITINASEFIKYLPLASELNKGISLSYDLVYSRTLINLGLANDAIKYLYPKDKERRYNIDKLLDTWKLRVLAHKELGEINKARNCLNIAYELTNNENLSEKTYLDHLSNLIEKTDY